MNMTFKEYILEIGKKYLLMYDFGFLEKSFS